MSKFIILGEGSEYDKYLSYQLFSRESGSYYVDEDERYYNYGIISIDDNGKYEGMVIGELNLNRNEDSLEFEDGFTFVRYSMRRKGLAFKLWIEMINELVDLKNIIGVSELILNIAPLGDKSFSAANKLKEYNPDVQIYIYEMGNRQLRDLRDKKVMKGEIE